MKQNMYYNFKPKESILKGRIFILGDGEKQFFLLTPGVVK